MKTIIFICVLALTLADEDFHPQHCLEEPNVHGQCISGEKYYYDYKRGYCRFYPLDCDHYTNKNIFDSEEDCINKCGNTPKFDTINCLRSPDRGTCPFSTEMYYFDYNDRSCKPFTYSGCEGNENRFLYKGVCEEVCGDVHYENECDLPSESGKCIGNYQRYYFDVKSNRCQTFSYSGCGGNNNTFPTRYDCYISCELWREHLQ